jgi:hypothetical protein
MTQSDPIFYQIVKQDSGFFEQVVLRWRRHLVWPSAVVAYVTGIDSESVRINRWFF